MIYGLIFLEYQEVDTQHGTWSGYKPTSPRWMAQYSGYKVHLFDETPFRRQINFTGRGSLERVKKMSEELLEAAKERFPKEIEQPCDWLVLPDFRT